VSNPAARSTPAPDSFTISLQIKHPAIDPRLISEELGLKPDYAWACGEPKGSASQGVRRNSFWCASLAPPSSADTRFASLVRESETLQRAVDAVTHDVAASLNLKVLHLRRHQAFIQRLLDDGGEVSIMVELPTTEITGFKIDASMARQLASLGVTLEFQFV
jgi:hypothetical protein